ncbi:hypothetical protein HSX11_17715 [Oxalobacteraceae bacterium]|nr:hypothetical protein [Oxalobacteraceae bacterium]
MPEMKVVREEMFPTTLWSFDLGYLQELFPAWLELIAQWRIDQPEPAGRSLRLGWNSDTRLLQLPVFAALEAAAHTAVSHALAEMALPTALSFRLEGWVNLQERGGYNVPHLHPNRLLSGCFYLQVPPGSQPLTFRDPRPAVALTALGGSGANSGGLRAAPPHAGQLLVFPSWLEHQVDAHQGELPRIAIGINAVLVPEGR